ncbi:MAG: hypothetical protein JW827_02995 [Spirochaetes bacterium]|nr:hypothetical protein [Spirochaetota bacterium]
MKRIGIYLCLFLFLTCASSQKSSYYGSKEIFRFSFESVWERMVFVLNNFDVPLSVLDKEHGAIESEYVLVAENSPVMEKDSSLVTEYGRFKLKINLIPESIGTSVQIDPIIEAFGSKINSSSPPTWHPQNSNGFIEESIFEDLHLALESGGTVSKIKPIQKLKEEEFDEEKIYARADQYMVAKNYNKALREYQKIINHNPSSIRAAYNIACVYAINNDIKNTMAWVKHMARLDNTIFERIEQDPDFANIIDHNAYKKIKQESATP